MVALPAIFVVPVSLAGLLAALAPAWQWGALVRLGLTAVTVVGGHLTLVVAVEAIGRGETPSLGAVLRRSLACLPRYLATNALTTALFWSIMVPATTLVAAASADRPAWVAVGLWTTLAMLGLTWHLHTLFAPYLAICAGMSPPGAVRAGFRMVRGQVGTAAATFVTAAAGAALPSVAILAALWMIAMHDGAGAVARLDLILPYLVTAMIELVRPILVASVHGLYEDLWHEQRARR